MARRTVRHLSRDLSMARPKEAARGSLSSDYRMSPIAASMRLDKANRQNFCGQDIRRISAPIWVVSQAIYTYGGADGSHYLT